MTYRFRLQQSRMIVVLVTVLALVTCAVAYDAYKAVTGGDASVIFRLWFRSSSYGRILPGMTKSQIASLLGRPDTAKLNPWYESWHYRLPSSPRSSGRGYVVDGYEWDEVSVSFDASGRVTDVPGRAVQQMLWPQGGPRVGMTKREVRELVGQPDYVIDNSSLCYEYWHYRLWNGTTFSVLLDAKGRAIRTRHVVSRAGFSD